MTFNPLIIKPLYKAQKETLSILKMQSDLGELKYPIVYIANEMDTLWEKCLPLRECDELAFNDQNNLSRAWNIGMNIAKSNGYSHLIILSNDILVSNEILDKLAQIMDEKNLDVISPSELFINTVNKYLNKNIPTSSYLDYKNKHSIVSEKKDYKIRMNIYFSCTVIRLNREYAPFDENYKIYYSDVDFLLANYYEDFKKNGQIAKVGTCEDLFFLHIRDLASTISVKSRSIDDIVNDLVSDAEIYYNKYRHDWKAICQFVYIALGLRIESTLTPNGYFDKENFRRFETDFKILDAL